MAASNKLSEWEEELEPKSKLKSVNRNRKTEIGTPKLENRNRKTEIQKP